MAFRKPRPMTLVQKRRFLAAIPVPPGMLVTFHDEMIEERWNEKTKKYDMAPCPTAVFAGDGITMRLSMDGSGDYTHGSGHTTFTTERGERTFDRTGVEDSFSVCPKYRALPADTPKVVGMKLLEQIDLVADARERVKNSVPVPGLGYSVTPETRAKYTADLLAGREVSFTPSGFGTGYRLTVRQHSRYDKPAKPETREFFGVRTLFIQQLDCD
jgi:hypothetical protein